MKVLVTGATGFIGRKLVAELAVRGHYVVAMTRGNRTVPAEWDGEWVTPLVFDLTSSASLARQLPYVPDALVDLAWDGLEDYTAPSHATHQLPAHTALIDCAIAMGISQILVAGSALEYGRREGALSEAMIAQPDTAYALAKNALRERLFQRAGTAGVIAQWARIFYIYGDGQRPRSLFGQLHAAIQSGAQSFSMSAGTQLRDYMEIHDAASLLATLLESKEPGVTNVCSGAPISVVALVKREVDRLHCSITLDLGRYPMPAYEGFAFWGDNSKIKDLAHRKANASR